MPNDAVIFTEGGTRCGYGHITRCTALYDEIKGRGYAVEFIINGENSEMLQSILRMRHYKLMNWCREAIGEVRGSYAIVDSYLATKERYEQIASHFEKVLFIDDTNRMEYPKGMVVNPSIFGESIPYNRKPDQEYLLGSDYVILRDEFRNLPIKKQETVETNGTVSVDKILVVMGGSDIKNLTGAIEETIRNSKYGNAELIIAKNMSAEQIRNAMLHCDIAISAAGQTVHELIACRLPFVCLKVIDNQEYNVKGLLERGIIADYIDCEGLEAVSGQNIRGKLIGCMTELEDVKRREDISGIMSRLNLGQGAKNIIDKVFE